MYKKSIFWFRQDLRAQDNTGLFEAVHGSKEVLPVFILDENITPKFGGLTDKKFGFIREALEQLSVELNNLGGNKVIVFHGKPEEIIPKLVKKYKIECIYTNTSYGTYGKARDQKIAEICGCKFESHKDFFLAEPHEVEQRKIFTPYYKLWQKYLISEYSPSCSAGIPLAEGEHSKSPSSRKMSEGQRELRPNIEELKITHFSQVQTEYQGEAKDFIDIKKHPYFTMEFGKVRFENYPTTSYNDVRNNLDVDGTSRLSPYLRFGVFSVRQIYNKAKNISEHFVSEMAWREFWWQIMYNFPETKKIEFQEKRRHIQWSRDTELFEKWCKGETGYPVVDAAMKQLNKTNWMHGRARMIVASFLTKDMHIDWRLGEAYFREKLLDYDEAVNLGNWQWSASVGADPKPLRIFNPILQSEKFDPKAVFIKKHLPEVELESLEAIHNPLKYPLSYCDPIVDHAEEQRKARELYKNPGYEKSSKN